MSEILLSDGEDSLATVQANVRMALAARRRDQGHLQDLENYDKGKHADPYIPDSADQEYRLLVQRSVTNIVHLVVDSTAQALFVDDFRTDDDPSDDDLLGGDTPEGERSPYWKHWMDSRMMQRQQPLWRSALVFGAAYTLTERDKRTGLVMTKGLSTFRTVPLFEDPTDIQPDAALYVVKDAKGDDWGKARYWDWTNEYEVKYKRRGVEKTDVQVKLIGEHGAERCPVTRFAPYVDLDGNCTGLVEPLVPLQDRLNQTVFDLLVAQTYTSHTIRTATGIAPPLVMETGEDGKPRPKLGPDGQPILDKQRAGATRFLFAENADVKFGQLPGAELGGLLEAGRAALQHISAVGQVPPHFLLGQIANVTAEALDAAATALSRKNSEIANMFASSVERTMRIFGEIEGLEQPEGLLGETIWRDLSVSSLAQTADALGKFREMLDIPAEALWDRVPGVTRRERENWRRLAAQGRDIDWLGESLVDDYVPGPATAPDSVETGAF